MVSELVATVQRVQAGFNTDLKVGSFESWEELLALNPNPGDDGWWIDDVTVSDALAAPATLAIDDTVTLAGGVEMPRLGFGTYKAAGGPEVEEAVTTALEAGYRSVDTASFYGNEAGVGRAIAASGSAIGPGLVRRILDHFGSVLYNLYGSTEVAAATIATPDDLARDLEPGPLIVAEPGQLSAQALGPALVAAHRLAHALQDRAVRERLGGQPALDGQIVVELHRPRGSRASVGIAPGAIPPREGSTRGLRPATPRGTGTGLRSPSKSRSLRSLTARRHVPRTGRRSTSSARR